MQKTPISEHAFLQSEASLTRFSHVVNDATRRENKKKIMHVSTFIDFDRSTLDRFSDFFSLDLCVGLDSSDLALRC